MVRPKRTKPDGNQNEIVAELRLRGYDVDIICDLPGLYDLVVSGNRWVQVCYGVDTKDDYTIEVSVRVELKSEGGALNETEEKYIESLKHPESYIVAYCVEDILAWFGDK